MKPPKACFASVSTSASGTPYVRLGDASARQVTIFNDTGATLRVARDTNQNADPNYVFIPTGSYRPFAVNGNAKELCVKRHDENVSQVVVRYEVIAED